MSDPHNRLRKKTDPENDDDEEEEDSPAERMLRKAGCLDLHYAVQDCMAENKDWRKCKEHVDAFRKCVDDDRRRREAGDGGK